MTNAQKKPIPWKDDLSPAKAITAKEILDAIGISGPGSQDSLPALPIIETIVAGNATQNRKEILAILAHEAPFTLNAVDLSRLAQARGRYFQADPEICRLGEAFR